MSLDRDEPADAEKAGSPAGVRGRGAVGLDPVVDDLEVLLLEPLRLGEVLREALRDRDVHVGERRDRAVGDAEPAALAELVEPVLRRKPERDPRQRPGELAVDVGVDEVRVQDSRANAAEIRRNLAEGDGIDVGPQPHAVEWDASRPQRVGELPGAGLVLVEHEEAHVPAALAQVGEELQEVRLRARDPGDLLRMEDDAVSHVALIPAASRMPRAHDCTEWRSATRSRRRCPSAARSWALAARSPRTRSASAF